jgi:hypothetical protein
MKIWEICETDCLICRNKEHRNPEKLNQSKVKIKADVRLCHYMQLMAFALFFCA